MLNGKGVIDLTGERDSWHGNELVLGKGLNR
jgi:hypothetical protein